MQGKEGTARPRSFINASRKRFGVFLAVSMLFINISACGNGYVYYRFLWKVSILDDGVRHDGAVVLQVVSGRHHNLGANTIFSYVYGEAMPFKLNDGSFIFLILCSEDGRDPNHAGGLPSLAFKVNLSEDFLDREKKLASTKRVGTIKRSQLPMIVRFKNMSDPKSIEKVELSPSEGGKQLELISSTVQIVNLPLSSGIESILPWLRGHPITYLDGRDEHIEHGPGKSLANTVSYADFRRILK